MDDVVAVQVKITNAPALGFLTWGRLFSTVDDSELLSAVQRILPTFGIDEYDDISVCETLAEVAGEPYFFEGLLKFGSAMSLANENYDAWRSSKIERVRAGKDIFFLGRRKG